VGRVTLRLTAGSRLEDGQISAGLSLISLPVTAVALQAPGVSSITGKPKEEGGDEGESDELIYQRVE
jgi:hypothetical protein